MAVNLEEWQKKRYEPLKVCDISGGEEISDEAEVVLANYVFGKTETEPVMKKILSCRARYVSVAIREEKDKITAEDVVWNFQKNGLDLIFMRDFQDKEGRISVRLDFERIG